MDSPRQNLLTPAQVELLQTALDKHTLGTRELASLLCKSPNTIESDFGRIHRRLHVAHRFDALLLALDYGIIQREPDEINRITP